MFDEMKPAPPVTSIRFTVSPPSGLSELAFDVVQRPSFDVALDALQVLAHHGHQESLQTEDEQDEASQKERAREVAVADPVDHPPASHSEGRKDTEHPEDGPEPLHELGPEAGEDVQRELDQADHAVAAAVGPGAVVELDLGDTRAGGAHERLRELLAADPVHHGLEGVAAVGVEGAAEVGHPRAGEAREQ